MGILVHNDILKKGWKLFTVMHADKRVASIREDGSCIIYSHTFMPFNLYLENAEPGDLETRLNNLNNFYYWCASRVLTLDRKYAKEILNSIGANQGTTDRDRAIISISYHGLSLTDVYWIKLNRERIRFCDISLFRHSLSGAFADVSLNGRSITAQNAELIGQNDAAGDVATNGAAPKAWIRENGVFYLLKNGDLRDVEAELLASRIVRCFGVKSVIYEADTFEGKKVSKSKIITSEEKSIVSAEAFEIYCANKNLDRDAFVLKQDPYGYYMMNIVDYLIGNTDRHWGNWGFSVDNRTNKPGELFPLMDFNKSFLAYNTIEGARCLTNSKNQTQREAALEAVRAIGLNQISEVSKGWFKDDEQYAMFVRRLDCLKAEDSDC